ncbi:MAG TPA: ATP-binding protein [Vicinamibacterales bacterium]
MPQRIPIQLHVANALQWLGTLYRSPAEAIKEHVSNAIDEHLKAKMTGNAQERCEVTFVLDRKQIVIEYPYGMSRPEFESALRRVADSAKRTGAAKTIGRLGIGIFSFQQVGRRCTFYSRKTMVSETLRVVLKEGADDASVEPALSRDTLHRPGLRVVISDLKFDPMRSRGPLAPDSLRRYLAEKFESYLRQGWLTISIRAGVATFAVTPSRIELPRLLFDLGEIPLPADAGRRIRHELHFDPSGQGRVAIRHEGVVIVDDLASLAAYGLEDSAWASGFVRGVLDADFLTPLPARSGFEENADWIGFLDALDRYLPTVQAELDDRLAAYREQQAGEIAERALRLARDILDLDEFRDLALPGGLAKRGRPDTGTARPGERKTRQRRSHEAAPVDPGTQPSPRGRRIGYEEVPFETGSRAHSRFAAGVVQVNTLHPDYQSAATAADSRLAYAALMIGKESIAWNDRSGAAGDFLEKLLDFYFKLQARKGRRGRRGRRAHRPEQTRFELDDPRG